MISGISLEDLKMLPVFFFAEITEITWMNYYEFSRVLLDELL